MARQGMRAKLLLGSLLLFAAAVTSTACPRKCETAENCIKSCDCLNGKTDQKLACPIAYRCEGATSTCEEAFDSLSCDEQCATYAAEARCGVARCKTDADCVKTVSCPLTDANGTPTGQFQDCTLNFVCELNKGESCDPASTADDVTFCAACFAGG